MPTLLFAAIDIYYLSLERAARESHRLFSEKLREGVAGSDLLFDVGNLNLTFARTLSAALSKSIWPFYILIVLGLFAVGMVAQNAT